MKRSLPRERYMRRASILHGQQYYANKREERMRKVIQVEEPMICVNSKLILKWTKAESTPEIQNKEFSRVERVGEDNGVELRIERGKNMK